MDPVNSNRYKAALGHVWSNPKCSLSYPCCSWWRTNLNQLCLRTEHNDSVRQGESHCIDNDVSFVLPFIALAEVLFYRTSIDSMICFSRPDVQPQFLVSLVANMLMFYLFVGKLSLGESVEKLAVAEIMIYPVVLIKKDPDTSRFGLGVKATCRQYVRAERERPFGFSLRCDSELCSATDPRGLKLKYHIEKNKRVRGSGGEWVSTPRFRIDCEGCSRRAMLDIPPGVTQLRSNVYVSDYPTVPQLTWRDRESNMHDHSTPISAPSENTLHEDTSKLSISEGASSTSRLDGPLLSGTPAPSLKSRKRARAPSAGEGAVVLKKKSRDVVGQ